MHVDAIEVVVRHVGAWIDQHVEYATTTPENLLLLGCALLSAGLLLLFAALWFGPWAFAVVKLLHAHWKQERRLKRAAISKAKAELARKNRFN